MWLGSPAFYEELIEEVDLAQLGEASVVNMTLDATNYHSYNVQILGLRHSQTDNQTFNLRITRDGSTPYTVGLYAQNDWQSNGGNGENYATDENNRLYGFNMRLANDTTPTEGFFTGRYWFTINDIFPTADAIGSMYFSSWGASRDVPSLSRQRLFGAGSLYPADQQQVVSLYFFPTSGATFRHGILRLSGVNKVIPE